MTRSLLTLALSLVAAAGCTLNVDPDGFTEEEGSTGAPPPIVNTACWDHVLCLSLDEAEECLFYREVYNACDYCGGVAGVGFPCDQPQWIDECGNMPFVETQCRTTCDGATAATADERELAWAYYHCSRTSDDIVDECEPIAEACRGE